MKTITEKTLLPLSLVIVIIGGVFWLSSMSTKTEEALASVHSIESKQDRYNEAIAKIREDIALIKGILERQQQ